MTSGPNARYVESFKDDVLSKLDVRYYNLEILYYAYYFLNNASIDRIVRERDGDRRSIIRGCKDWLNDHFGRADCPEKPLLTYISMKYSKNLPYQRRYVVLDIVRYIDIILHIDDAPAIHDLGEPEDTNMPDTLNEIRMQMANEHALTEPPQLMVEDSAEELIEFEDDE